MRGYTVLEIIFSCWFLVAPLIVFAWTFRPYVFFDAFDFLERDYSSKKAAASKKAAGGIIGLSAFFSFVVMLQIGADSFMDFLPKNDIDRACISHIFGFIMGIIILALLIEYNEKRRKQYIKKYNNKED